MRRVVIGTRSRIAGGVRHELLSGLCISGIQKMGKLWTAKEDVLIRRSAYLSRCRRESVAPGRCGRQDRKQLRRRAKSRVRNPHPCQSLGQCGDGVIAGAATTIAKYRLNSGAPTRSLHCCPGWPCRPIPQRMIQLRRAPVIWRGDSHRLADDGCPQGMIYSQQLISIPDCHVRISPK